MKPRPIKFRKRGKYFYYLLRLPTGNKWLTTHCETLEEAQEEVRESGITEMATVASVTPLTHQAIGYLTVGKAMTVEVAKENYLEAFAMSHAPNSTHPMRTILREWIDYAGIGKKIISSVTEGDIDCYVNRFDTLKASTKKQRLGAIRTFLDYCLNNGWCYRRPAALVHVNYRQLTHEQKEKLPQVAYTEAEVNSLVTAIREKMLRLKATGYAQEKREELEFWQAAIVISFNTGLRLADVAKLEWDSFSEDGTITVHTAKTNKRVQPEMKEEVMAVVRAIPRNDPRFLFPTQNYIASMPTSRSMLSIGFRKVCESLKQPYKGFHSLRRGYATARSKAGDTLTEIAKDMGHSDTKTTEMYVL